MTVAPSTLLSTVSSQGIGHAGMERRWRRMARVAWLQHRAGLLGLLVLYGACAVTIALASRSTRSAFATYVSDGCVANLFHAACPTLSNTFANTTDPFSVLVIALNILPVVVGVFLGAPLVSRELESGTYRFAFTQALSRSRYVLMTLAMFAGFITVGAVVMGLLLATWSHPFEVVGIESMWQSGLFATSWFMLAAWSLLGLALGVLVGVLTKRVVMAMAGTMLLVGGLVVASSTFFVRHLLSMAPLASKGFSPVGLGLGVIAHQTFRGQGPPGDWLVGSWMTGRHGDVLSQARSQELVNVLDANKGNGAGILHSLAVHHVSYWVSYQPATRYWIFQGIAGAILLVLGAVATAIVVRRLRHL